jgi:hypothetical protein
LFISTTVASVLQSTTRKNATLIPQFRLPSQGDAATLMACGSIL